MNYRETKASEEQFFGSDSDSEKGERRIIATAENQVSEVMKVGFANATCKLKQF